MNKIETWMQSQNVNVCITLAAYVSVCLWFAHMSYFAIVLHPIVGAVPNGFRESLSKFADDVEALEISPRHEHTAEFDDVVHWSFVSCFHFLSAKKSDENQSHKIY